MVAVLPKEIFIPTNTKYGQTINQYTIHVEQYYKADNNKWIFSEYSNSQDSLNLASIACQISLEDIYNKVNSEIKE